MWKRVVSYLFHVLEISPNTWREDVVRSFSCGVFPFFRI
jgi:hypothetical protein